MTQVEQYKRYESDQRKQVLSWLQMGDHQLSELIFEQAYEYLEKVFGTDAYGMEQLPKTTEFWTWWRMEWNQIDRMFLEAIKVQYKAEYPEWYCVIADRDTGDLGAVHTVKELHRHYLHYHEASMSNRFINSSTVRAHAHDMINSIIAGSRKEAHHG